jgi:thioredoxin reductase
MTAGVQYDAIIVGAGPAGLSAALVLGRCRERVLVLDDAQPRNKASHASHGFFTRDGTSPESLRRAGLEQLAAYDVSVHECCVTELQRIAEGFIVGDQTRRWSGRKLLLATGMRERDTQIPGIADNLGAGVFCCPYCDGWEVRERALGGLAMGQGAAGYALGLLTWSAHITLFTHGCATLEPAERAQLERNGVAVVETAIERVIAGECGRLRAVCLKDGSRVALEALFVHAGQHQHSRLAEAAGCELADAETLRTRDHQRTNVPGLFVAGDAAAHVESIAVAAADGYRAALAMHSELRRERLR